MAAYLWRWALRLVHTPASSLPSAVASSTASNSSNWRRFLTSGPRRQSHAALELLEKFRQGPETQSEWNLFLWRATFPLVSLVLLTLLCVIGQFGHAAYSLAVNPVWYYCNLTLVTSPFMLVFRFSGLADEDEAKIWRGLAAVSVAISLVEWYMSVPASRYSWIVGNTLFGIVALGAVPLFFSMQPRTARSQYEALVQEQEQETKLLAVSEEEDDNLMADDGHRGRTLGPRQRRGDDVSRQLRSEHMDDQPTQGQPATRLLYGCIFCALVVWLIMFSAYSSARGTEGSNRSWFVLYLLSPVLCIVLFCARIARVHFSFEHAVAYSTLVVHVPLFLGHLCVRLFALAEDTASSTSTESWLKLAVSVLYLLLMQGYFFVITHMVNSMSEPFAHPSLLYVGQLYYYVFWYILVGSDTPIDALYWGMLLLNNIHIAFLNTGVYTDFKRTSSAWLAMPLHANITSSVAVCVRSTTSVMDITRCLPHGRSLESQGLLGLNCGVAGAAAMGADSNLLEDEGDYDSGYGSDGFLVARNIDGKESSIGNMPSWQETGSRIRERDRSTRGMRRDTQTSALDISSPSRKTGTRKASSLRDKYSHVQMSCKKCGAQTSGSSRPSSENVAPVTSSSSSASRSSTATSEALRPLYFLMKLAEQDNMADTTALILVPSLLTLLAVFEKPGSALIVLQDQTNLWLRCICMFIGRLGGAFLAREIFRCKLRSRLRSSPDDLGEATHPDAISGSIDGMPARLWIQRLMLQDFHAQFWYLTAVTMVVTVGCFARVDLPLRFALLS